MSDSVPGVSELKWNNFTEASEAHPAGMAGVMQAIFDMVDATLSEPYSMWTYRHFIGSWPDLTLCVWHQEKLVGVIVSQAKRGIAGMSTHLAGYIAMLVVHPDWRKRGIGIELSRRCLLAMEAHDVTEVVLEAEADNAGALALYESLGFVKTDILPRYYMSGSTAYRLKLFLGM